MIIRKMSSFSVLVLLLTVYVAIIDKANCEVGLNPIDKNYSSAYTETSQETSLDDEGSKTTITSHSPLKTWLLKGTTTEDVENKVSKNEVIERDGRVTATVDENSFETTAEEQLKDIRFNRKDVVIKSSPLDVLYGRVTLINPLEHLYIRVREHDKCIVKVINDRAFLPRAGVLHPSEFDCQFGINDVWYAHLGGRNPQMDTIKLLIKYQTDYNTFVIPAALQIRVVYNKQLEVVTKNVPLKVEKNLEVSNYLNINNTVFSYEKDLFECFVNIFNEDDQFPRYGNFSSSNLSLETKSSFLCDEFLNGSFSYKQSVPSSLRTDFVPVKIDLYSRENGSLVKQEFFHKTILIPTGKANGPPSIASNSTLYLDVYHSFLTPLTQKTILFSDKETSKERILIVLKSPLDPQEGKLISTDNPQMPIISFHQKDITDLKIAFVPSENITIKATLKLLKVTLVAVDEEGASSAAFEVTIAIHYWNSILPQSMKFEDVFLQEGESKTISLVSGSNYDNATFLTNYQIVDGLTHGQLTLNGNITQSFTSIDLDADLVAYNHDGSETVSDNLVIELFTNNKIFELLLPVSIFPVDDSSPKLITSNELELKSGREVQINELYLRAEDKDNENSVINYKLLPPFPQHGYFALKENVSPGYSSLLNYVNRSHIENEVTEWTQEDIHDGRLFYIVRDPQMMTNDTETATFTINDNSDPPNYSEKQNLTIKIATEEASSTLSNIYKISNKLLSTFEHQIIPVTEEYLSYGIRNNNSNDSDMLTIYHFATNETTGSFHISNDINVSISDFTQRQINDNSIIYRPPPHEIGLNEMIIHLVYNLTFGNASKLNNQTFSVVIKPVNNMSPEIHMEQAKITNGSYDVILTRKILKILDKDTDEAELLFRLVTLPRYGNVLYKKQTLFPGSEFTIKDIENENIRYESNIKEAPNNDFFVMEIDDRIHRLRFTIDIASERDVMNSIDIASEIDSMSLSSGNVQSPVLTVNECGRATITTMLWLTDIMPTGNITYIIEKAPQNGVILRHDKSILKFLWEDIQNEAIVYAHDGDEIGMNSISDQFSLMVLNSSPELSSMGTDSHSIKIDVLINPVDNTPPDVTFSNPAHVTESLYTTFGAEQINITDMDSTNDKIVCFVTVHPSYGYLKRKENGSEPFSNFTTRDLTDESISYVQNVHNKTEPRSDFFSFQCSDSLQISSEKVMKINIDPFNDETPETTTEQIIVTEGSSVQLLSTHLNTVDLDEPKDIIVYSISTYPKFGKLATDAKDDNVANFTQEDVITGKIWYFHDGSESRSDYFELTVSDGILDHEKFVTLHVSILPVDDQPPEIKVNKGITLNMNDSVIITNEMLSSTDLDSGVEDIIYLIKSLPRFGVLELIPRGAEDTPMKLSFEKTFTQQDVDNGLVRYRNTIYTATKDSFSFKLKDLSDNTASNNTIIFKIELKDSIPPTVFNDDVELFRGGWIYITKEVLKVADQNTPDKFLTFTITKKPSRGELKHADNSASEVNSFTQLDISANKILYIHNSKFNDSSDSFGYYVTDGFNIVQRNFRIHIDDVNAEKPILHLSPVEVEKGLSTIVTNSNLKIEDSREPPKDLTFIITRYPRFGSILLDQKRKISKFSQEQVNDHKISYHHDGSKDDMDDFQVLITDGFHEDFFLYPNLETSTNEPQVVHIKITPREQLTLKDGLKQGLQPQYIPRNKFKGIKAKIIFQITAKNLNAEGVTHPGSVIYIIEEPPKSGYICNIKDVMKPLASFTQDDVNNGVIRFVFNEDTKATYDIVKFRLMDEVKGLTTTGKVQFEWSFIKLEKDFYAVNQSEKVDIFLTRRGSLEPAEEVNLTVYNANDEPMYTDQAKFSPGDDKVRWTFKAAKNEDFAEVETVRVKISDGVMAATEEPDEATIFIRDNAEESIVEFTQEKMKIAENSKKIKLKVKRVGDTYKGHEVLCYTVAGTANGTRRGKVDPYSDYVTRPKDKSSLIRFKARQTDTFCEIQIIDDSQVESEESFTVNLASINGGRIGTQSNVTITIQDDINDYPHIFFAKSEHYVDEGAAQFEIWIFRSGSDLRSSSSVEVVAKLKNGKNKLAKRRKKAINVLLASLVEFPPESKSQPVTVSILDDSGRSIVEGLEAFKLELRNPKNAKVNDRSETSVIIKDRTIDVPLFEFTSDEIRVVESDSFAKILISRKGDTTTSASVRCYTRSGTATDDVDYTGRPDSDFSMVTFQKGDTERYCDVRIIDDFHYEKNEYFGVFLSSPVVEKGKAIVGPKNFAKVVIDDTEDEPVIFFETSQIQTTEPNLEGDVFEVKIKIHRKNHLSSWVLLRVYTKDSSATSGEDYIGLNKELYFYPDSSEVELIIEILGDTKVEPRESFTVNLEYLKSSNLQDMKVTTPEVSIFIEDPKVPKDKVFPAPPIIVSTTTSNNNRKSVSPGFPVMCLTACDEQHPQFKRTNRLCKEQNIDNSLTIYRWQVSTNTPLNSHQNGKEAVGPPRWKQVPQIFFARSNDRVLDKLFITPKGLVQCYATAVSHGGHRGTEAKSAPVPVNFEGGLCPSKNGTHLDALPYVAKVKYIDSKDWDHPNTVSIEVLVPHQDGMIPIISTRRITSVSLILSVDSYRVSSHKCSNLLEFKQHLLQKETHQSRLKKGPVDPNGRSFVYSMEMDAYERFYGNLDEDSCLWKWTGFFSITDLVTHCGAEIAIDKQETNEVRNQLQIKIPLFVTYAFYSPDVEGSWRHINRNSELGLNLAYDSPILPSEELQSTHTEAIQSNAGVGGTMTVSGLHIEKDGRISVDFTTESVFRGKFQSNDSVIPFKNGVTLLGQTDLTFTLKETHFTQGENYNIQTWRFVADVAAQDYSGTYLISLIPCISPEESFNSDEVTSKELCNSAESVSFEMEIKLQQVMNPVAEKFSLNSRLSITKNKTEWLDLKKNQDIKSQDTVFYPGDRIYGSVFLDSTENLGGEIQISIDKCFVCTAFHNYIPKFDPQNGEFGCLENTDDIQTFKLIDKRDSDDEALHIKNIPFNSRLVRDEAPFPYIDEMDGFSFDVQPLFQNSRGDRWFIHVIFVIGRKNKQRFKRQTLFQEAISRKTRKENTKVEESVSYLDGQGIKSNSVQEIGSKDVGTNMCDFYLKSLSLGTETYTVIDWNFLPQFLVAFLGVIVLVACITITSIIIHNRRNRKEPRVSGFYSTVAMTDRTMTLEKPETNDEHKRPKVLSFYSSYDEVTEV